MATITSLGIGTNGLDSQGIVSKLVALDRAPLTTLQTEATLDQAKITEFGKIKSEFSALSDAATAMSSASAWISTTASSSNTAVASITATSSASPTSFSLDVDQLATAQSTTSAPVANGAYVGAGTMTISIGTWTPVTGSATSDNTAVSNSDSALPAAQAALATANANLTAANSQLTTAQSTLDAANTALATATSNAAGPSAALATANATLASATADYTSTNNALTTANSTLASANSTLASATTASSTADANVATATTNFSNATTSASAATSASSSASAAATSALADDNTAAINLAVFANSNPNAQRYSDAYTTWVTAVGANDHSTPSLQAAEDAALQAKNIAYGVLGAVDPTAQSGADAITATADATDASALKLTAKNAATAASSALTAASAAATALSSATGIQTSASAALASATNDVATATSAQAAAAAAFSAASDALTTATSDQAAAAATAAPTNAALASATSDQATAAAAVTTAQTAVTTAQAAVTTATTNVANATAGVSSSRPTFTASSTASPVAITVTNTDTVASLAAKINAANAGVVATTFFDGTGYRLQLHSSTTGAAAGYRIQVSDSDGNNTDNSGLSAMAYDPQTSASGMASSGVPAAYGQDAKARINGLVVTSSTNTFANNFPGVTFTVASTTTTNYNNVGGTEKLAPITLNVAQDVTAAVTNVQNFITAYNALATNLITDTAYNSSTSTGNIFQADSSIVGLQNVLSNILASVSTGSSYGRLSDVGIELQLDGTLTLNTTKLSAAANNGDQLIKLFTANNSNPATNGFALKFANFASGALLSGGLVASKANALQSVLDQNTAEQAKVNAQADAYQTQLTAQYSALDGEMASLNALNSYITQQIATWNKSTS